MNDKYYVVCYNRAEFEHFTTMKSAELFKAGQTSISKSHFVYVGAPHNLKGIADPRGWLYGRWREREDIKDVLWMLFMAHNGNHGILKKHLDEILLSEKQMP